MIDELLAKICRAKLAYAMTRMTDLARQAHDLERLHEANGKEQAELEKQIDALSLVLATVAQEDKNHGTRFPQTVAEGIEITGVANNGPGNIPY